MKQRQSGAVGPTSRRRFIARAGRVVVPLAGLTLLSRGDGWSLPARAQDGMRRVGYLSTGLAPPAGRPVTLEAVKARLLELGWIEGQTIGFEPRYAENRPERIPDLIADLAGVPVDVIVVAGGSLQAAAAKQATSTIPLVTISADPVGAGLVPSLERPGGNVTGVASGSVEILRRRVELLKEVVPELRRVAILAPASNPVTAAIVQTTQQATAALGVEVLAIDVGGGTTPENAFDAMVTRNIDAFVLYTGGVSAAELTRVAELAVERKLPSMDEAPANTRAGGLMGYGPIYPDLYRRMGDQTDEILRGADPATMAIALPITFEFVVNLQTARAIGLTIPPSVLAQATEVIGQATTVSPTSTAPAVIAPAPAQIPRPR